MTLNLYMATKQFPKSEKFSLAMDIKRSTNKIVRLVIEANKIRNKKMKLYEIDTELSVLKNFIRISKDLGYLSLKRYENITKVLLHQFYCSILFFVNTVNHIILEKTCLIK